jgi:hypothetical protein
MKLLTVDEVLELWRCHRVTILRLMERGILHWVEVDGEPLFDKVEVQRLKHPRIGKFPHLTLSPGGSHKPPRVRVPLEQLVWRYERIDEMFEKLTHEARWLAVEAQLCVARSREARSNLGRAREASWIGVDGEEVNFVPWISLREVRSGIGKTLPPRQ